MPDEKPDPLAEIKNRILQIEDLIPWRQNEFPKFQKEIEALKSEAHELRNLLSGMKTGSAKNENAVPVESKKEGNDEEGGHIGFWKV